MQGNGSGPHPEAWWAQFLDITDRFDGGYLVEKLGDLIMPRIGRPLLRREVELAAATVERSLARPANTDLAEQAEEARRRLSRTLERLNDRAADPTDAVEAEAMRDALCGRYAAAAAAVEPIVGSKPLMRLFVTALRLEHFDIALTLRLLGAGRPIADAVASGVLVGRYRWWPTWLVQVMTERALAGTLDESTVAALDNCAYASLSQIQAHMARKLLGGDASLIARSAQLLEGMGERDAAERLRQGDFNTVALAARLMSE